MKLKKIIPLWIFLFIFWIFLTLNFYFLNYVVGAIITFIVSIISYPIIEKLNIKNLYLLKIFKYLFILLFNIYKSSIIYIKNILSNDSRLVVVEVHLTIKNPLLISIVANSITLTPGTTTIDYYDNKLIVLALISNKDKEDKVINGIINNFEKNLI